MALLSQVSTSYPRVPRDSFARTRACFFIIQLSGYPQFMLSTSSLPLHGCWSLHYDLCPSHFHTHSDTLFRIISALSLSFHIYSIFYWKEKTCFFHFDLFWKHCHPLHCVIYSKYLCSTVIWFSCLVFTAVSFIQQTCKIFSGWFHTDSHWSQAKSFCWFPVFFSDFRIFLFQQSATGTFISIDKFTKFCSRLRTEYYMHMINIMILLYHRSYYRTSVPFAFAQFVSRMQRKENSCYIMLISQ